MIEALLEIIFSVVGYYTGLVVLSVLSFGKIRCAPLDRIDAHNKSRWEMTIFLNEGNQRILKVECVILVGMLFYILVGVAIYFGVRN
jgi:hypothetical protein